jgi:sigma-B regulation protein RsbU (phosphoserine phosphatase)
MFRDERFAEGSVDLEPGDLLVVYSDGLVEARDHRQEEFGMERLRRILPALHGLPASEAGARVLAEADRFLGHERPEDDLSLVLIARHPAEGRGPAAPPRA